MAIRLSSVETQICRKQVEFLMVIIVRAKSDEPPISARFFSLMPLLPPLAKINA